MDMVSVIVPIFNAEKFLPQCIESIFSQTYKNWELLLIDDGSTDNSSYICDEFAKNDKVRVWHLTHKGPAAARNYGLENIRGDFIMFVDADDWIDVNYIEKMLAPFTPPRGERKLQLQDADITLSGAIAEDELSSNSMFDADILSGFLSLEFFKYNLINPLSLHCSYMWGKLYPKRLAPFLRCDVNYIYNEDIRAIWKLSHKIKKVFFVDSSFYHYRNQSESITHKLSLRELRSDDIKLYNE